MANLPSWLLPGGNEGTYAPDLGGPADYVSLPGFAGVSSPSPVEAALGPQAPQPARPAPVPFLARPAQQAALQPQAGPVDQLYNQIVQNYLQNQGTFGYQLGKFLNAGQEPGLQNVFGAAKGLQGQEELRMRQSELERRNKLSDLQLAQGGYGLLNTVQSYLDQLPEDQRQQYIDSHADIVAQFLPKLGANEDAQREFAKSVLGATGGAKEFARTWSDLLDEGDQRRVAEVERKTPGKGVDEANRLIEARLKPYTNGVANNLKGWADQARTELGKGPDEPLTQQEFKSVIDKAIGDNPNLEQRRVSEALTRFLGNEKNAPAMEQAGISSAALAYEKAKKEATRERDVTLERELKGMVKLPDGRYMGTADPAYKALPQDVKDAAVPVDWKKPDEFAAAEAVARIETRKDLRALNLGAGMVGAKAAAERKLPAFQGIPAGKHVVDLRTGYEINVLDPSLDIDALMKDHKNYRVVDAKSLQAIKGTHELDNILDGWEEVVKEFTKRPGANLAQALDFWAQNKLGKAGPGVAVNAMEGTALRIAKDVQGSAQSLSNIDLSSVRGFVPGGGDTFQSAMQRIGITRRLSKAMRDAELGIPGAKNTVSDLVGQLAQPTSVEVAPGVKVKRKGAP